MKKTVYDIAVIGEWHLAFVTAGVLASCGHKVALVNSSSNKWTKFPTTPVYEPGLQEILDKSQSENLLSFENGVTENWEAPNIWLAVDTPVNNNDEPDTRPLLSIVDLVKRYQLKLETFIVSSQVPLGFGDHIYNSLQTAVVYVPENLRLGKGIETFYNADRTVIGGSSLEAAKKVQSLLTKFKTEFILTNLVTAEMVKHANNIFLATSISFANELARLGEKFGVDSLTVGKALRLDKRIGTAAYVLPGLGFAGGTLPRDLRVVQNLGQKNNVPTPLVDAVLRVNENTTFALAEIVSTHIQKQNSIKNVLILGYTYKSDTDTLRRSLSIDLANIFIKQGISVSGYDPVMNQKDLTSIENCIKHYDHPEFKEKFSVIICMTARNAFKDINWFNLSKYTYTSCLVIDTQNILKSEDVLSNGLNFQALWSPVQKPIENHYAIK